MPLGAMDWAAVSAQILPHYVRSLSSLACGQSSQRKGSYRDGQPYAGWFSARNCQRNSRLSRLRRALTPTGTLVIAGSEGARWTGVGRQIGALMLSPVVRQRLTMYISTHRQADLEELRQHIEAGHLTPIVGKTYPLPDVPDAIRHLEDGRAQGKIAIRI